MQRARESFEQSERSLRLSSVTDRRWPLSNGELSLCREMNREELKRSE